MINNTSNDNCFDVVTLIFNNSVELNLLKLQAHSYRFVCAELVSGIYIVYNDNGSFSLEFILSWFPVEFRRKVHFIYRDSLVKVDGSSWENQQLTKLIVSRSLKSKYYLVLDCKDHFIRCVGAHHFFNENKPHLFIGHSGLYDSYHFSLNYFGVCCPFNSMVQNNQIIFPHSGILLTTTPFLFIRSEVLNLIEYVEQRHADSTFIEVFLEGARLKQFTEFFFYGAYLAFSGGFSEYSQQCLTLRRGVYNGINEPWNHIDTKTAAIDDLNCRVFTLHRSAISGMTPEYKSTLLDVYRTFYSKEIVEFIANRILRVGHPRFTANYFLGLKDQIILEKFFTFRFRVINWKVFFQRLSRQSALRLIRKIGKNLSGRV